MKMPGMLPVESVRPNSWNVNAVPDEEYAKLKEAIKTSGPEKMEPITVRKAEDGAWEIVNGEQRWKMARELGWKAIPAVEVEVDRKEAKFLCLSYNALRGTVDFLRLSELLQTDQEMVEAAIRVFGKDKTERLIESGRKLTPKAKETLKEGVREGAQITLEKVKAVAETPEQLQHVAARAAKSKTVHTRYIKAAVEQFIRPGKGEEVEKEAKKEEEAKEEKGEEKKPFIVGGKAYEIGSFVEIAGRTFLIYFDPEKKKVGIAERVPSVPFDEYHEQFVLPKWHQHEFKCKKCGALYVEKFDASTGEFKIWEKKQ